MKKIFALVCCFSLLLGCAEQPTEKSTQDAAASDHSQHAGMDHSQHAGMNHSQHESLPAGAASDQSIYQLEASWQNQQAQPVSLGAAQGKVQLVAMVYASCKNACPRIIADMKAIEDKLAASSGDQLQLTLVSIDPEVDTPARLQALADKSKLSPRWQLLTGDPDDVLTLAALLGVQYKKISETDYAHSNIISVLNPAGEIVHQQQGLGVDPAQTVAAVQAALSAS